MSTWIETPRTVLLGLTAVAVASVLGLVFMLGRESARPAQSAPAAVPAPAPVSLPVEPAPEPAPAPAPSPANPSRDPSPAVAAAPPAPAPGDPQRAAVASYFQAVRRAQPEATGNPEALAQQLVAGLAQGDPSGFERMIRQTQATRALMATIQPPPACATYHQESLACLDAGLDLMAAMQQTLAGAGDPAAVAARANALKARSQGLEAQEQELRRRFGL